MTANDVQIAVLETKLHRLATDISEVSADVKIIRDEITAAKGGWKMMLFIGGVCTALGAFVSQMLNIFGKH